MGNSVMTRMATFATWAAVLYGCGSGMDAGPVKRATTDCGLDCDVHGECTLQGSGKCVARDNDCKRARVCELNGKCTAKDGICVAAADSECKKSVDCDERQQCFAVAGRCDTQQAAAAAAASAAAASASASIRIQTP